MQPLNITIDITPTAEFFNAKIGFPIGKNIQPVTMRVTYDGWVLVEKEWQAEPQIVTPGFFMDADAIRQLHEGLATLDDHAYGRGENGNILDVIRQRIEKLRKLLPDFEKAPSYILGVALETDFVQPKEPPHGEAQEG